MTRVIISHIFFQNSSPLWFYRTSQFYECVIRVKVTLITSFLQFCVYYSCFPQEKKRNRSAKDGARTRRRSSKQSKRFAINRRKFPVAFNNWPSFAFCTLCTKFLFAYTEYASPLLPLLPPSLLLANFISLQLRFVEP